MDAADSSTVDSSGTTDESQVAASREVLLGKEDLQANRTAPGSDQEQLNAENRTRKTHDDAETIGTTSNHPFWSVDRGEYVQAGSLEIGERLQTLSGDVKVVQQKLPRPGPHPVFNLEVHDEHVYFVGHEGVLVHNAQGYKSGLPVSQDANGRWHDNTGKFTYSPNRVDVSELDFSISRNRAVFYSGPGNHGKAMAFAERTGATPIDLTSGGEYLNSLRLYDIMPSSKADEIWRQASMAYASGAKGKINLFVNGARPDRVFHSVEAPIINNSIDIFHRTFHY